ncbi:MAG: RNA polymerase sigma factor [Nitriliruptoraceae bacterium]
MNDEGAFARTLDAARTGDPAAWSALYHDIAPVLIGYLRAQHLPDADDVAGEVLLEVARDLGRFDGGPGQFRSWVLTIAHHRLIDARRRDARRPADPTAVEDLHAPPSSDDPEAEVVADIGLGELEPALATLTEDQRTVLLLRVIADLSIAEVARITGRRAGAVKQLQRRATAALRQALTDDTTPTRAPDGDNVEAERAPGAQDVTSSGQRTLWQHQGHDDGR